MPKLILHPVTERQLETFSTTPSHALLLVGPKGSGKFAIARMIAETVLGVSSIMNYPYNLHISPTQTSIGIEAVRHIEQFLSLKVPGPQLYKRTVIIEHAEQLSIEAQNALLKNLEEPPTDTLIILTTTQATKLLSTIRSRAQTIMVTQPDQAALKATFPDIDTQTFARAYAMSGGRPGLLTALVTEADHPLNQAADYARQLLGHSIYDRLLLVDELVKTVDLALDITLILQQMAHISLQTAHGNAFKRWQTILTASYQAAEALNGSVQPKLALTNLMLHL